MSETTLISLRLQEDLRQRIDKYTAQRQKESPTMFFHRSEAIRELILVGLEKCERRGDEAYEDLMHGSWNGSKQTPGTRKRKRNARQRE